MRVIGALDQGTVNTKFSLFDEGMNLLTSHSIDHKQIHTQNGWLEHDPQEIFSNALSAIKSASSSLLSKSPSAQILSIGIANQRETLMVWDKETGNPLMNAIVWLDTRTNDLVAHLAAELGGTEVFRRQTGLPLASYFTGVKLLWLFQSNPQLASKICDGRALIGTVDTWLVWKLTAGTSYITDVTNASRTLLMDINSCKWSADLLKVFCPGLSVDRLPTIVANCEVVGKVSKTGIKEVDGVDISAVIGDQQAACIGHGMFESGEIKATFGTGATVVMLTGVSSPVFSTSGLLSTPCFQFKKDEPVMFALEGSLAIAGAAITWLTENLGALETPEEAEGLLTSVEDTGDVYFVPAFNGLFAPRWRADARGCIVGLTQHSTKAHIVRALFESIGFQLHEILVALKSEVVELTIPDSELRIDGGMCSIVPSSVQLTADIIGKAITTGKNAEITSLGTAMFAAVGSGVLTKEDLVRLHNALPVFSWKPHMTDEVRTQKLIRWEMAVERSLDWEDMEDSTNTYSDRLAAMNESSTVV